MRKSLIALGPLALLLTVAVSSATAQAGFHVDKKFGYKVKIPSKWTKAATGIDEKWIQAQYLCNRTYQPKGGDYYVDHQPRMRVIVITDDARKVRGPEVVKEDEGSRTIVGGDVPYQDYKDYVKRNQGAGHFYLKEDTGKLKGVPVSKYEIKLEKMTVPRRLISWVFRGPDAEYSVEFEVLEDHYKKLAPICYSALKTFRLIKRDAALSGGTTGSGSGAGEFVSKMPLWERDRDAWKALNVRTRKQKRKAIEEGRIHRMKEGLPKEWKAKKGKHFQIFTKADPKYTKKVVDAAEACRSWCEKTFGKLSDEYVMKGVIRIFADDNEYRAYLERSGDAWNFNNREILACKGRSFGPRSEFDGLFRAITRQYIDDKDALILSYWPDWLEDGILGYVETAMPKGSRLDFGPDTWENNAIREARRDGTLPTMHELMHMTDETFRGSYQRNMYVSVRLARYLMGPGKGDKLTKGFLLKAMKAVIEKADEIRNEGPKVRKEADSEEEEEARFKARQEDGKKRARDIIAAIDEAVCSKWSEKNWKKIEAAFEATLK